VDVVLHQHVLIHHDGRGVAGIKAHQRAVRFVGVEAEKRAFVVDQVLREDARDQRFADPAFSPPMKWMRAMIFFL
jgi:hypothetical protein